MAYLREFPRSPYWFAGYTAPDRDRVQRSTKQSLRKKAQLVAANEWEKATRLAAGKRLGEAQARHILGDIYQIVSNEPLRSAILLAIFLPNGRNRERWTRPRALITPTLQIARDFIASLGERANLDVSQLTKADVAKFRDEVLRRTSVGNANKSLKYVRVALGAAYKDGVAQENPAARLDTLRRRETDRAERGPLP